MKTIIFPLLAFIFGFSGVFGYQYFKTNKIETPVIEPRPEADQPVAGAFTLVPPTEAVSGILTVTRGHAEKFSRGEKEYKEASSGAQILLGESIATKENSAATAEITGIVSVHLAESSELVFANLFPENMVLQQKAGKIEYTVTKPISVRALHTLVTINPGQTTINIIDTDASIMVKSGSVKFALVDTDDNTHVWDLQAGQRANIDDTAREVSLIKAR